MRFIWLVDVVPFDAYGVSDTNIYWMIDYPAE